MRAEPRAGDSAIADSRARAFYRGVGPAASDVTASAYRCKHKNRVAAIVGAVDHVLPLPGTAFWRRTLPRALHSVARRVRRHIPARVVQAPFLSDVVLLAGGAIAYMGLAVMVFEYVCGGMRLRADSPRSGETRSGR